MAGRNTFYKYECKYKICLPMTPTGSYKLVRKVLLETLKASCEEVHG